MFIPSPFNFISVLFNQLRDCVQFMTAEVARSRKLERLHPLLHIAATLRNVNVHRFTTIEAEKEETIASKVMENSGHLFS